MNAKEKTLCLRIVSELITSYSKVDIASPVGASDNILFDESILTPSWLVEIKQEVILGKYIRLTEVIEKIKVTLVNSLREMGPYLTAFFRILLHEQILHYEIQKLPRSLKNVCKTNDQQNKDKKNKNSSKITMKRRGDKKFYTIQSTLLNTAIEEEDALSSSTFYNNTAKETEKALSRPVKVNENKAGASKSRKMTIKKSASRKNNVPADSQTPRSHRYSKRLASKSTTSPKTGPENKSGKRKTAAAASKTSNSKTKKMDQTGQVQPSRLRKLLTLASDVEQNKTSKKPEKTKLGKRKLPQSENQEAIDSQSNTTEMVSGTVAFHTIAEGQPTIKLKRMTFKDIKEHIQNVRAKRKPLSEPNTELTTQSEVRTDQTENSNGSLKTTTPELKKSTLKKDGCATNISCFLQDLIVQKKASPEPLAGLTTQSDARIHQTENSTSTTTSKLKTSTPIKDGNTSTAVPGLFIVPGFKVGAIERSVGDTLPENIHDHVRETEKTDIAEETTMLLDMAGNHSLVAIKKEEDGTLTRQVQRKKRSSKFQQKGNQLMGIEEEEIPEKESDIELKNDKGTQEVTVGSEFKETDPKFTNITIEEHKPSQESIARKHQLTSRSSEHQTESRNTNLSIEEITSGDSSHTNGKVGDDEPEVLRVVTKETYKNISKKILGIFDKIEGKNSEIRVEKVIVNETIPDDDEQDKQPTGSLVQKESADVTNTKHRKGKSLLPKKVSLSSKGSARITKKKTPTAKKQLARVLSKTGPESTNHSLLIEENQSMSPADESIDNDSLNEPDITIDDNMVMQADEWLNTELIASEVSFEALVQIPEVPEISCFLHACQKVLRLPFFTHFEFELSLIIPHASCLMATVITALLSGVPSSKETKMCSPLPYLQWNRKLTARISHWYLIYQRLKNDTKVQDLIGIGPIFWKILGNNRNPLSLKPFHQLPIHQRVTILRGLCDHFFHVSKRIQMALISTPRGGREGNWLGEDSKGLKYLHIPIFLREYVGDLRVYCVGNSKLFSCPKEESRQETETCSISQDRRDPRDLEGDLKKEYRNETDISEENQHMDITFSLVADSVEKLNSLVTTVCSPFAEDELSEAEKKLGQKVVKVEAGITNQEFIKTEDEDDSSVEVLPDIENTDSRNEHLLLAVNLKSLFKSVKHKEDVLNKSRAATIVKLHLEWKEFNKDGFSIEEKPIPSDEKHQKKRNEKQLVLEKNDQLDDSYEEPSNIKNGQQPLPKRESLSRRAKLNAGSLSQEKDTQISRREIVADMEERALVGSNNLSEEESKWDPSLWADEDSDDDAQPEDIIFEDSIWSGYAAIQKEATHMEKLPPIRMGDRNGDCSMTKQASSITKTYNRKGSLTNHKMTQEFSSKHDGKIDKPVVITDNFPADSQEEIKILSEKLNGKRLNSYRIKIKKEDLDYCLVENKPEILIDLVRKNIAQHNQSISTPDMSRILCGQNQPSNSTSTRDLDAGSELPLKNVDVLEVKEISTSQSLTKKILNSLKRKKLQTKCESLGLSASKSTSDLPKSAPLTVLQLRLPTKDAVGNAQLYTKQELEKVTTFVHKAVNEINQHTTSTTPQATTKEPLVHNDNQAGITGIRSKDDKEIMTSSLNHESKLDQSTGMTGAPEIEHKCQTSGFKPFVLKSLNTKLINIQD